MKLKYIPKTPYEKFALQVYLLLVENFPESYYVGGAVRNLLLKQPIDDIDIATAAKPDAVSLLLRSRYIETNGGYQNLGLILALQNGHSVSIATFRKERYKTTRYPEVSFTANAHTDAKRRDFTINALYFKPNTGSITDFFGGERDTKNKRLKFVGEPALRIKQDPLRIVRALRFALEYQLRLENKTKQAIVKYFYLLNSLTQSRLEKEIAKPKRKDVQKILQKVINSPQTLDKYFK